MDHIQELVDLREKLYSYMVKCNYITIAELARRVNVHYCVIREFLKNKRLPNYKALKTIQEFVKNMDRL